MPTGAASTVFISHASGDLDKVELLVRLLRFHGFEVGYSDAHSECDRASYLLAIISANAAASESLKQETALTLRRLPPEAEVFSLSLDETSPASLAPELATSRCFEFGMKGLDDLFGALGAAFLNFEDLPERRQSDVGMRLRKGMWLTFYRWREAEKFESLLAHGPLFADLEAVLIEEARRYRYTDRATAAHVTPEHALGHALQNLQTRLTGRRLGAIFLIEELAAELLKRYEVESIDRRKTDSIVDAATPS